VNPKFSYKGLNIIPEEEVKKYNKIIEIIYSKIISSLRLHNYPEGEINNFISKKKHIFSSEECVSYKDIEKYIKEHYNPFSITIQM
jgi:hypothetical protein